MPVCGDAAVSSSRIRVTLFRLQPGSSLCGTAGGVVESYTAAVDALNPNEVIGVIAVIGSSHALQGSPSTGLLQPFHLIGRGLKPAVSEVSNPARTAPSTFILTHP